jgi:hypothetical protein
MNAWQARQYSDSVIEQAKQKALDEKMAQEVKLEKEAKTEIKKYMAFINRDIVEAIDKGRYEISFFPPKNKYLLDMIVEQLRRDGYTTYMECVKYSDEDYGTDTFFVSWRHE